MPRRSASSSDATLSANNLGLKVVVWDSWASIDKTLGRPSDRAGPPEKKRMSEEKDQRQRGRSSALQRMKERTEANAYRSAWDGAFSGLVHFVVMTRSTMLLFSALLAATLGPNAAA